MRITKYRTELNENLHSVLVKETSTNYVTTETLDNPTKVTQMLNDVFRLGYQTEENVYLICLSSKSKVTGVFNVTRGTANSSLLNPREILIKAFMCNAVNIIVAHNHPSGDSTPSKDDIESTKQLKNACDLIKIPLLDHIIVVIDNYTSLKERGLV